MKKILIISFIPYPLRAGGQVAQFAVLDKLQHKMDVTFCAVLFNRENYTLLKSLQELLPKVKVISAYNGGFKKQKTFKQKVAVSIKNIISITTKFKKNISVNITDDFYDSRTNQPFDFKTENFLNEISNICKSENFDFIQTEFHPFLELISIFPKNVKTIFVAHESRYLRLKSSFLESKASDIYKQFILQRNRVSEIGLLAKYNAVITFSDFDKSSLELENLNNVHAIPFPIIDAEFLPNKTYAKPNKIVFIGNQGHTPNKDGLIWYLEKCHNKVYQKFSLPLVVIGNWALQEEVLKNYNKVEFVGTVESIDPYYKNAILVVPIFTGSGIRTKILYGMAKKVPIISTELGCQGLEVEDKKQIFIANNADATIENIDYILKNEQLTNQVVENAYQFVSKDYNQEAILNKRLQLYNSL